MKCFNKGMKIKEDQMMGLACAYYIAFCIAGSR